ncbi:hypothetical protein TUM4438_45600 [Shewanella sairae]|uniref:Uncharacterized protein n=1 Tax=Shewanella sairae TaxID=190310 RepID=A0ABQ4PRT4_9GAMM|nr:hypothetical protein [Shewanella sairae]MCL1132633.1 hypothetical protein [Shewanella sairae]GIU52562.1 hypothetical protein TUM4438_45600 [Shewanella sairae]
MKSLKHLQDNLQWFDFTFLSQYLRLDSQSEEKLPVSFNFFRLPLIKELLLGSSLLPFLLTALIIPSIDPKMDFLRFPILTVLWLILYIAIRKKIIKAHLGIDTQDKANSLIIINDTAITLPRFLTGGPIAFAKTDIKHLQCFWDSYHDTHQIQRKRAHTIAITLYNGQEYQLMGMAYPLRSLLYLAIHFNYPLVMQQRKPPKEPIMTFAMRFTVAVVMFNLLMLLIN